MISNLSLVSFLSIYLAYGKAVHKYLANASKVFTGLQGYFHRYARSFHRELSLIKISCMLEIIRRQPTRFVSSFALSFCFFGEHRQLHI